MGAGGRNQEKEQRERGWKQGLLAARTLLRSPQGSMGYHFIHFFFLTRMRNAGSMSEIIANSKLVRFHGLRKGAGGKIGRWGVF